MKEQSLEVLEDLLFPRHSLTTIVILIVSIFLKHWANGIA